MKALASRLEAEERLSVLSQGLVALEGSSATSDVIEPLMRAAHSLKGAARIVGLDAAVRVAHAMEDCLVAAQQGLLKLQSAHIEWHGVALGRPDWRDDSHSLAFTAHVPHWSFVLHGMFNAYREPLTFDLPRHGATPYRWQRCVDTALESPDDFCPPQEGLPTIDGTYRAEPHSCVVLISQLSEQ